jgi:hypothetical protein
MNAMSRRAGSARVDRSCSSARELLWLISARQNILFSLDGEEADAFLPVQFVDGQFEPGPATLTVDGETRSLTRLDTAAERDLLEQAEFLCRK